MTREELAAQVADMRWTARLIVERHAAIYARDVPIAEVDAITAALGDISLDEAMAAIDRRQRELFPV